MQVRSLGYRTDLIFAKFDGQIVDRGDFMVIRTTSNPFYYWGNFLLFPNPPTEGDANKWRRLFAHEFGAPPACNHQTFGWDSQETDAVIGPFLEAGFRLNHHVVMVAANPRRPTAWPVSVSVRPLTSDAEWADAVDLQIVCREPGHDPASFGAFRERQMLRYRRMAHAGLGSWFGAYVDGRMVANLGLFHDGKIGRYQTVETHPEFRRRGIAGSLVYEAGRRSVVEYGLETLVIVADHGSGPARLYAGVGFEPVEAQWGLEWWTEA